MQECHQGGTTVGAMPLSHEFSGSTYCPSLVLFVQSYSLPFTKMSDYVITCVFLSFGCLLAKHLRNTEWILLTLSESNHWMCTYN